MRTLLRLWCRTFGHRWEQWTKGPPENEPAEWHQRCARCLDWKMGASPTVLRGRAELAAAIDQDLAEFDGEPAKGLRNVARVGYIEVPVMAYPDWTEVEPWGGTLTAAVARLAMSMADAVEALTARWPFRLVAPAAEQWVAGVRREYARRPVSESAGGVTYHFTPGGPITRVDPDGPKVDLGK